MTEDTNTKTGSDGVQQDNWRPRHAFKRPFDLDLPLLLVPFAVVAAAMGLLPLRNWDYWWHVSVGRVIDVYGAVPNKNHYLYTMPEEAASFVQPWLSEWLMMWLHDGGGIYVGLTARNLLAALAFTLVGTVASRRAANPMVGTSLAVMAFAIGVTTIFAGPSVFATLLFAVVLAVAYGVRDDVFPLPTLVALPLIAALWANMDAAFLLPAGVALAFAIGAFASGNEDETVDTTTRAAWVITFGLCLAAPLLNPRGVELYTYMANTAFDPAVRQLIPYGQGIANYLGDVEGIVFVLGVVLAVSWTPFDLQRIDRTDVILMVLAAIATGFNARLLPFFGLVFAATSAVHLRDRQLADEFPSIGQFKAVAAALLLLFGAFGMQRLTNTQDDFINSIQPFETREKQPLAGVVPPETPVIHAEILAGLAVVPKLYHDRRYAGFLIFQLAEGKPDPIVFVDSRVELPSSDVWELYRLINDGQAWRGAFQQFGVNSAILNKKTQAPLIDDMRTRREWQTAYEDDYNVLFVRE